MVRKVVAAVVVGGAILLAPTCGYSQSAGGFYCDNPFVKGSVNSLQCPATLGALSLRLEQGMSEDEVKRLQPFSPYAANLQTCGQHAQSGAWTCKIWEYSDGTNSLEITFSQDDRGGWLVNDWSYNS